MSGEGRRLFTLAGARALLPLVRPILTKLADQKRDLDAIQDRLIKITPQMRGDGHRVEALALEHRLEELVDQLTQGMHSLERLGVELKDIDNGIVDFPAMRDGRVVLLCWRLGEADITHWHEAETGFAGRRPLGPDESFA